MKKQPLHLLYILTALFFVFTLGFFLGRTQTRESIRLTPLPGAARHDFPPETSMPSDEESHQTVFPIDLNTAAADDLAALPGIGDVLAQRILDYRKVHGPFCRPEELLNVEGIGPGKLEEILDFVITGG